MEDSIPERIYLQRYDDDGNLVGDKATWCEDRINESDIEYYHVSEIERLRKALRNIVDNVHSRIEMYNRAKQALKEK